MVIIGNTTLPGVQTEIESASNSVVSNRSEAIAGIVGHGDLVNGSGNENEVYKIRSPVSSRKVFGPDSVLSKGCSDALVEGAYPIYAVSPGKVSVTGEDLSGLGTTSGTLTNAPGPEDASEYSFTVDSTPKSAVITYEDPSTLSPGTDEVYVNPVTGAFELDAAPSTSGSIDYSYFDYKTATEKLYDSKAHIIDLVGVLTENEDVVRDVHNIALEHAGRYEFTTVIAGAKLDLDTLTYNNPFDSSRIQLLYPARNYKNESIIGAYVGLRSALGINKSPMLKRLNSYNNLSVTLTKDEQEYLLTNNVVPIANDGRGAKIIEDVTCVTDDNIEESSMKQVLHRLIVDYVTEFVNAVSEQFIGELHTQASRNSLEEIIGNQLSNLVNQDSITAYVIHVEEVDAFTASVDVGIDTVDPLRNILVTVTAGEVTA